MNRRYAGVPVILWGIAAVVVLGFLVAFAFGQIDSSGGNSNANASTGAPPEVPLGAGQPANPSTGGGSGAVDSCTGSNHVSWDDAANHLDQKVALVGPAMDVQSSSQGVASITIGVGNTGKPVTVVITSSMASRLPKTPQELYAGKTLCVIGVLQAVGKNFQIVADQPNDISVYNPS